MAQAVLSLLCLQQAVLQAGWVQLGVSACFTLRLLKGMTWSSGQRLVLTAESCSSLPCCALAARPADSQVRPPGAWGAAAAPAGTSQLKTHAEGSDSLKATQ